MSERKVNVLLGCTGSVASIKLPLIIEALRNSVQPVSFAHENITVSYDIKVVATEHSLHFFQLNEVEDKITVLRDEHEWLVWKKINDPVLHIELRRWADIFVIAPLDANTLAKIACGMCDNLLTCVVRAWDSTKPLLFCPAMNTHMWHHPVTAENISKLKSFGYIEVPCVAKRLACGDLGLGGMAEVPSIIEKVNEEMRKFMLCKDSL